MGFNVQSLGCRGFGLQVLRLRFGDKGLGAGNLI